MIRTGYVLPRVVILGLLVLAVTVGADPLFRWWLKYHGPRALGVQFSAEQVKTNVLRGHVLLRSVKLARDHQPPLPTDEPVSSGHVGAAEAHGDDDYLTIQTAVLEVDLLALAERRLVIDRAILQGVTIPLDDPPSLTKPAWSRPEVDLAALRSWVTALVDLSQVRDDLAAASQTLTVSGQIRVRWRKQFDTLAAEASELAERIRRLEDTARTARNNPLRAAQDVEKSVADIRSLRQDLASLQDRAKTLLAMADTDREALKSAYEADLRTLTTLRDLPPLEGESLIEHWLGAEQAERIAVARRWIERIYALQSWQEAFSSDRRTGEDIPFGPAQPRFLIRRALVTGAAVHEGQRYPFSARLEGLTDQPGLYGQPCVIIVSVERPIPLVIEAVLDRTGQIPHDAIHIRADAIDLPGGQWGPSGRLAVAVGPSQVKLDLSLERTGEDYVAHLRAKQSGLNLTVASPTVASPTAPTSPNTSAMAGADDGALASDTPPPSDDPVASLPTVLQNELRTAIAEALAPIESVTIHSTITGRRGTPPTVTLSTDLTATIETGCRDVAAAAVRLGEEASKTALADLHQSQETAVASYAAKLRTEAAALIPKADRLAPLEQGFSTAAAPAVIPLRDLIGTKPTEGLRSLR